jgi:DNA-directed RNA polymerase specialized sigma24 family protein/CheY-like chemotaxis protein
MPTAGAVAPYLPYLRRYARALTGSQPAGDSYVAATLEAVIADPQLLEISDGGAGTRVRVALYRIFAQVWNSLEVNQAHLGRGSGLPPVDEDAPSRNLASITPLPRQAFLLRSVEGFTTREAAEILGCDADRLGDLIDQAGQEIAAQVATDILIIEDDPLISMDLTDIVESLGHRVVARTRTHAEAVRAAQIARPGLVLADIQLADGSSGLLAVKELVRAMDVAVIFITAFPERVLTGNRPEPTFLITKPFTPDTVRAIVSQALFFGMLAGRQTKAVA